MRPLSEILRCPQPTAQGDQFASWYEDAKLGLFTHHLLEALRGAAGGENFGNGDGKVTVAETEKYLGEEMTYQARRYVRQTQFTCHEVN